MAHSLLAIALQIQRSSYNARWQRCYCNTRFHFNLNDGLICIFKPSYGLNAHAQNRIQPKRVQKYR
jgi:hypothetical protein